MSDKIKILAYVNLYPPGTNAGAELMLHEILIELKRRGHTVTVAQPNPKIDRLDGIKIISYEEAKNPGYRPDVVFTQNHDTKKAVMFAQAIQKPIVHFVHNDQSARLFRLNRRTCNLLVANSNWVSSSIKIPGINKIVINPPTDLRKYQTERRSADRITFINLIDIKGVDIFWQLARIMPHKKFLAVKGGYGEQVIFDKKLDNVKIVENTDDMKSIYSQTNVLIVPSKYESWGRVGIEAMSSGIPVIASRTKGLEESLGSAAIFVDGQDVASYFEAITSLESKNTYTEYSEKSLNRAKAISQRFGEQIDTLERYILSMRQS